jgi:hypothetical protein
MKQRILLLAVMALGINAVANLAGVGSATVTKATANPTGSAYSVIHSADVTLSPGLENEITVHCPSGQRATGGGFHMSGHYLIAPPTVVASEPNVTSPTPSANYNGWLVRAVDPKTGGDATLDAWVVCVKG